jgi:nucleotide-binding universal stress UspA family protein
MATSAPRSTPLILIATDGSPAASRAAEVGTALVGADVELLLATVVPPLDPAFVTPADALAPMSGGAEFALYESILQDRGQDLLAELASTLGVSPAESPVLAGSPGPALRDYAEEKGVDAIIVGAQGLGAVDRLLMGSVSDFLTRKAHCPVLVVGPGAAVGDGPLIIATDGSPHAQVAAQRVLPLVAETTPLTVATVTSLPADEHPVNALDMLRERSREGAGDTIDAELADRIHRSDAAHAVLSGDPAEALVAFAVDQDARALVIGTRGHGGLGRAVLGSVAQSVLRHAPCPVYVVGPKA